MEIFKFDEIEECPKCGLDFALTRPLPSIAHARVEVNYVPPDGNLEGFEYLIVVCKMCGYEWNERCYDFKEQD